MVKIKVPFKQIYRGVEGSEGPCFDRRGRFFCVASDTGSVMVQSLAGKAMKVHVVTDGIPGGLQLSEDGMIWIADMKRGILATNPDEASSLIEVVTTFDGAPIRGCNDLCFDPAGNCYFTAPAGSWEEPIGEVYSRAANGQVRRLDSGYQFSNGIAVSPDGRWLIVAETRPKKLWSFALDVQGGVVGKKRLWGTLTGNHLGGPDGIDFSPDGSLLLAVNWGGGCIEAFAADSGRPVAIIETPFERPSNLHFSPDGKSVWITEHTHMSVWRTDWPMPGLE
jgi:gluconolactonase